MGPLDLLRELLFDYTLRTVALGSATLGIVSGALGAYAVLRKQSLLGDAISHAALPGIALAFLLTGSKAPLVLILGAVAAGWVGTLLVMSIVNTSRVKDDSALGIVLSVFYVVAAGWLGVAPSGFVVAVGYGLATCVFPWFLVLPALGFGVLGVNGPPRLRLFTSSVLNHLFYGLGLWWSSNLLQLASRFE